MTKYLKDMTVAAAAGGAVLRKYFGQVLKEERKTILANYKTKADVESEAIILKKLQRSFPNYSILTEEAGMFDKKSEYKFVVDPLDGTNNFTLGVANFAVSIALLKGEKTLAGVVYDPILKSMYCAERGSGAYMNGRKIRVSEQRNFGKAVIYLGANYETPVEDCIKTWSTLNRVGARRILTSWAPALEYCRLASGRIEAVVILESEYYDFLAGEIIAEEAGAKSIWFAGKRKDKMSDARFLCVNNMLIGNRLVKVLSQQK